MKPDVFEAIGYGSLVLLLLYVVVLIWRKRAIPGARSASRVSSDANTQALRENSELLRELIAINRKLLEKQDRSDV